MIRIIYPDTKPRIKTSGEREQIFCMIRKRWLHLTPEEWVRQNFLLHLCDILHYPPSLIAVEKQLKLGSLSKRFDIVVYDRNTKPFMLVECKEMGMPLSQQTIYQLLRYQSAIQAKVLVVTNGILCVAFHKSIDEFLPLEGSLPAF